MKFKKFDDPTLQGMEDKFLSDRPECLGNFGMLYNRSGDESYAVNMRYVGSRYDDNESTVKKKSYFTADVKASKRLDDTAEVEITVRNIFKPKIVKSSDRYEPEFRWPGIIWNLGVSYDF